MDSREKTASFPGLTSLGLSPEAWDVLAEQGSLCAERRRTGSIYKLRFRLDGTQQSRYVGKSPAFVDQIQRELAQLQVETRSRKRLRPLVREAKRCLKKTKRQVEPSLPRAGCAFHGREIRRRRHGGKSVCVIDNPCFYGDFVMDEHEHEPTGAKKMIPELRKTAAGENQHDRRDRRTQRIDDLTDQALEESDPLRANLKVAAAQLFDISYRLGDELQDNVSPRQAKPKTRRDAAGGVSTLMLVHRQITRYVQLDQQWVSEKNSANRTGAPSAAMDGQAEG